MIDKRINYRYGGDTMGGPYDRSNDRGNGGNTNRERGIQQSYSAPAPSPKQETQKEVEKDAREQYISNMYTKPTVTKTEDKVPDFVKQVITPTVTKTEDKVPDFVKQVITPTVTPTKESNKIDVGFQEALRKQQIATDRRQKQQDSDYGQFFRQQPVVEKPKSSFLKGVGNIAMALIPGLLPGKLGTLAKLGTTAYNYSQGKGLAYALANKLNKSNTLTNNLTTPRGTKTINTTFREGRDGREEGIMQAKAPKDVITENVQKFLPEQLDLLQQRYAELNKVIESGEYRGQKLNKNQLATLTQTSKQMKDFLVSEVGGMRLT